MYHIWFIHLSVDKHLNCSLFWAIMTATMNAHIQVFLWTHIFIFLGDIPWGVEFLGPLVSF